jgi:hypothetical protein
MCKGPYLRMSLHALELGGGGDKYTLKFDFSENKPKAIESENMLCL